MLSGWPLTLEDFDFPSRNHSASKGPPFVPVFHCKLPSPFSLFSHSRPQPLQCHSVSSVLHCCHAKSAFYGIRRDSLVLGIELDGSGVAWPQPELYREFCFVPANSSTSQPPSVLAGLVYLSFYLQLFAVCQHRPGFLRLCKTNKNTTLARLALSPG